MTMNAPENICKVIRRIESSGHSAYLVGGCVRDAALGVKPHDYDVTTDALPSETLEIFKDFRVVETGLKHGTLTVISDGEPVEVTTYRVDGEYKDNRRPSSVAFTDKIEDDLSRRDFTVNAMAYSLERGLYDPFGGIRHLRERIVSCVGEPEKRFNEDGLRILRALRFASVLDFEIAADTAEAVKSQSGLLDGISSERIYSELRRLICGDGAGRVFAEYGEVIERCFRGIIPFQTFAAAADNICFLPKNSDCRIAYLISLCQGDASEVCRALKASKKESLHIAALESEMNFVRTYGLPQNKADIKRMMGRLSREDIILIAEYAEALGYGNNAPSFKKEYESIIESSPSPCVKVSELNIRGSDIRLITGAEGAEIGTILSSLLELVITEKCENTYEALSSSAKKLNIKNGSKK